MLKTFAAAVTVAGLAAGVAQALPVTFDFTTGPNGSFSPNASPYTKTVGVITVTATGGSYAFDSIVSTTGRSVTKASSGLGVGCFFALGCNGEINGPLDLLTLNFGTTVAFESVKFSRVNASDSFDLFLGTALKVADQTITGNNPFSLIGYSGQSISFGADALDDSFRLESITVSEVPLPGSMPLLLVLCGMAGVGIMARRRAA